ncbi:MAG TPA: glucoamylase family protein [Planctomycetia bacterium]|nr:glucoamylase family protein [Planctomycetia bacterium]
MPAAGLARTLLRLDAWRQSSEGDSSLNIPVAEPPLRAELYSIEQLERHAREVAASHRLATGRTRDVLLPRLEENQKVLFETYDLVAAASAQNRRIEPAAEWLLDNFYLIEDQIRAIRRLLPPSYSRELPRLASGSAAGFPRAYGIALELISHADGRVDAASLDSFIAAYQSTESLKLGELWALPLMLRLALIENLRRVAARIAVARRHRDLAGDWAERMVGVVERKPTDLVLVLADMARANPPFSGAFLAELTRHLQGQNPSFAFANSWLEHRLADHGLTTEQLVRAEGQAQAADQVSIGNSINSLRFLNSNDWRRFVGRHSLVEQTLAADPAGVYAKMDFTTRDRYRHAVEGIARRSRHTEYEVARKAVQLAERRAHRRPSDRAAHVGYYLVDRGRPALERLAEMRLSLGAALDKARRSFPLACYLFVLGLATFAATYLFMRWAQRHDAGAWALAALFAPALVSASNLGLGVVNWLMTQLLTPQSLPRLDFEGGIPPEHRTLVAVPSMLTNAAGVERLLDGIETRYLANRDPSLHFALLTDFVDAATETTPDDEELVRLAREGIERLNAKYADVRTDIFHLFHRARLWNAQEGVWMGYERKRGKLADLNAALRGAKDRFATTAGETEVLQGVRFVITLDTDTQLPRDAARVMVGTLAHPLNRPVLDERKCRVVDGYTILQPRVDVSLLSAQRSRFALLYAGNAGVDPYTRVVSDVYQELFGEGSFIGKGIYDVDSFERRCGDFPENAILSHDLIEGAYCRSALLSDVTLYEDHPSSYAADMARRHRWMRGDWQIAGWLFPRVPGRGGARCENPISLLSRWKVFDNLRRTLATPATLLLLLVSWMVSPAIAWVATLFTIGVFLAPAILSMATDLLRKPIDLPLRMHLSATLLSTGRPLAQNALTLVFLPYEAYVSADAIVRTLTRMLWTRRRLLEWKTASDADGGADGSLGGAIRLMAVAPALAVVAGALLLLFHPVAIPFAAPWLVAWFVSPLVAWWLSRPIPGPEVRLSEDQHVFLEKLSRKTWRYFEEFVTEEENWLPPDNIQLNPLLKVASRTSPTNIGMGLLADLAAFDFGYCSAAHYLDRAQRTLETLARMERYRGHLFNWYDTRTLAPLYPSYVSMVDSGNLTASLLVLASGCEELCEARALPPRTFGGLRDTLRVTLDAARGAHAPPVDAESRRKIERLIETLEDPPTTLRGARDLLARLTPLAVEVAAVSHADAEFEWWAGACERACKDHLADLSHLAPWLDLPAPPADLPELRDGEAGERLQALQELLRRWEETATVRDLAQAESKAAPLLDAALMQAPAGAKGWLAQLREALSAASERAAVRIELFEEVAAVARDLAKMDFGLLYDPNRDLFAIGYNVSERRLDASYYDLLASEARMASYIVVAQGDVGQEHWFSLGRLLTSAGSVPALLSWSGSMFEYLMPLLVMPTYENTLLDRTYHAVVRRQIEYGRQRGVPWGISESGYNTIDQHKTYQYRAFGVPGLGLKRGLAEDLVIAPYASVLALMVAPEAACHNLQRLTNEGQQGGYGFFEAVDYTPSRLPPGAACVAVRQFMAHHEGMSLLSLAYVLLRQPMQRRFMADPVLRAAGLLLQERVPKATAPVYPHAGEASATRLASPEESGNMRVFTDPNSGTVEAHLLSNGRYHVAVTSAGGGYSRWRDLAVTRWREDATRDCHGSFCYVRDRESGALWSNSWQPTTKPAGSYEAIFTQSRAEFRRTDDQIETYTQISVSPEDDIELRRVTLTNRSETPRILDVTSYAEVVLAPQTHDEAHPAFSNLFVQTELVRGRNAIYCTRRARSAEERPPWMTHMMTVRGPTLGEPSYETDRMRFIGRHRTLAFPAALEGATPLSDSEGSVLDPIVSIRQTVLLAPNEAVQIDIVTGAAESREGVDALTEKYSDASLADRVFHIAWTHGLILLQQLSASEADAQTYGRLAGSIIYSSALRRAKESVLSRNRRGQSGLWGYGISGDVPIVLVQIRDHERIALVGQAVQAHAYWRMKGLAVDLVIWNEDDSVYRQTLQEAIVDLVAASPEASLVDRPGGVFIRRGEQMSEEDRALFQTVARIVLVDDAGTLAEQAERRGRPEVAIPSLKPARRRSEPPIPYEPPRRDLAFFNGLGGFSHDGREYVMVLAPGRTTPAPWVNVIANSQFGTVVSEGGGGYTWSENCHEFRLTPWHNDPVSDLPGEAVYLRDEETGRFWSLSPSPARGKNTYLARHGFGYSIFDYTEDGLTTELCVYVAVDAPVKFYKLRIANRSGRARQLSITGYWELVLGDIRRKSLQHVVTESDQASGAILARNPYNPEFGDRVAFFNCSEANRSFTGDRAEFLGRNGKLDNPSAMRRVRLSRRIGAGYDPCAAFQTPLALEDGQERTIVFTIGAGRTAADAKSLAQRFRSVDSANRAIEGVWDYWSRTLGVIYVETPDASVNFLTNGWLVYQTLACRMWARSGFYQSGGAFGFRDQLQDAMALVHAQPQLLREHLLRAAGRQFREGDVQHWWHPPVGRGVRTQISDDYLWLPLAACRYVGMTGDNGVLEERIPFLTSRPLHDDEESNYDLPQVSDDVGTLFEHCVRAIDHGLRFGTHGLPLMGGGDWNDGMNLVGRRGKGESVWLGFFLFHVLEQFAALARRRGETAIADRYAVEAGRLRGNIEANAWDGEWYRRAYFDDGAPLGSSANEEGRIDSISQSWSVLSGAGIRERSETAMESVDRHLVRRDDRLILLLDPPFDKSGLDPGYIKGYVPGVRENGGQYTHGAIWTVMAAAAMGNNERAWELFSLINPVSHGATAADVATYRAEPYVVAADVYGVEPHAGRGGWTWYTGSAGWMYRLITESLLGLRLEVDKLHLAPCLPMNWTTFRIHFRYRNTFYHFTIRNSGERSRVHRLTMDGAVLPGDFITLVDDGREHGIDVEMHPGETTAGETKSA